MEKVTEDCSMPNDGAPDPPPDPPQDPLEALKAEVAEGEDKLADMRAQLMVAENEFQVAKEAYEAAGAARLVASEKATSNQLNDDAQLEYADAIRAHMAAKEAMQGWCAKVTLTEAVVKEEDAALAPKREALSRALVARDMGGHEAAPEAPEELIADDQIMPEPPAGATPVDDEAETTEVGDAVLQAVAAADRMLLRAPWLAPPAQIEIVAQPPAEPPPAPEPKEGLGEDGVVEQLYPFAVKLVVERQMASASLLDRHLRCDFLTACKLVDRLEQNGVVSKAEVGKPRRVLITTVPDDIKAKLAAAAEAYESSGKVEGAATTPPILQPEARPAQSGKTALGVNAPPQAPVDTTPPQKAYAPVIMGMPAVRKSDLRKLVLAGIGVVLVFIGLGIGFGVAYLSMTMTAGTSRIKTINGAPQHGIAATKATPTAKVQKPVAATQPTKAQPAAQVRPATAAPAPAIAPRPLQRYEGPPPNAPCRLSLPPALAQRVACADPLAPDTRCIPCPRGH